MFESIREHTRHEKVVFDVNFQSKEFELLYSLSQLKGSRIELGKGLDKLVDTQKQSTSLFSRL